MSRQNKVNPGTYTQRGRLTQDDAARELRKQSAIGSSHTWQPVNKTKPWRAPGDKAARVAKRSADNDTAGATSPQRKARPAARMARNKPAAKAAASKATVKAATATTVRTRKSLNSTVKARTQKRTTTTPKRKAVRAGNRGG